MVADKRRADLVIPYKHTAQRVRSPPTMVSSTLPMAAMFMRNKLMAWTAIFSALQSYLSEPKVRASDAQPAWITLITAVVGLLTCYSDFIMSKQVRPAAAGVAQATIETISSTVISATGAV